VHDAIVGPEAVSFLGNRSDLAASRHRIEPRTGRVGRAAQRALVAGARLHGRCRDRRNWAQSPPVRAAARRLAWAHAAA